MSDWTEADAIEAAKKDPVSYGKQVYALSNKRIALSNEVLALRRALSSVIDHWREFGATICLRNVVNKDDYGMDDKIEAAATVLDKIASANGPRK